MASFPNSRLTFDVEVLCVALAVALGVGGDAGVEAGLAPPHVLQHQRPVPDEHAARHVLPNRLALWGEKREEKDTVQCVMDEMLRFEL